MSLTHLNPASLHTNPAFSQGVLTEGAPLLFVGGQNGTDSAGEIVSDDLGEQTAQAFRNVLAVLSEGGADQSDVAKLTIYLQAGQDVTAGYQAAGEVWGAQPTAITVLQVPGFARPDVLVEIDAVAVLPVGVS